MRKPHPFTVPLLLIALVCAACGASARTQTLRVSLITLNGGRDTLRTISKEREAQIVSQAASKEDGKVQLAAWRVKIDKIEAVIEEGYHAIYAAALLDDLSSVKSAGEAVQKALTLINEIKALKKEITP